jgi:hypothetical protein
MSAAAANGVHSTVADAAVVLRLISDGIGRPSNTTTLSTTGGGGGVGGGVGGFTTTSGVVFASVRATALTFDGVRSGAPSAKTVAVVRD